MNWKRIVGTALVLSTLAMMLALFVAALVYLLWNNTAGAVAVGMFAALGIGLWLLYLADAQDLNNGD